MSVHIGVVVNFHMTRTYLAVVEELRRREPDLQVTWFGVSGRWMRWLRRQGVDGSTIVDLRRGPTVRVGESLVPKDPFEPRLEQIVSTDRVLGQRPPEASLELVHSIASRFASEVSRRGVDVVFGESTWTVEVAMAYAARSVAIPYLSPAMVRYPQQRFGFFRAPLQRFPLTLHEPGPWADELARTALDGVRTPGAPMLWAHNKFDVSAYARRPGLLLEKLWLTQVDSRGNPTQMSLREYARSKNPLTLGRQAGRSHDVMRSALKDPQEVGAPYVLMPLQVQPEASVDVLAAWASDQVEDVRRVADALPPGVRLAVKEHSHQFGARDPQDYERIASTPGVVLVDAFADSRPWADGSVAVVAPTGSMTYEHALRGGRSFVMSPMYFSELANVSVLREDDFTALASADRGTGGSDTDSLDFLARLASASTPGLFSNPRSNPEVLDASNIAGLATGLQLAVAASRRG